MTLPGMDNAADEQVGRGHHRPMLTFFPFFMQQWRPAYYHCHRMGSEFFQFHSWLFFVPHHPGRVLIRRDELNSLTCNKKAGHYRLSINH